MGLRDEWESEDTGNAGGKDCGVWKWLAGFDEEDRGFLLDKLGNRDVSSEGLVDWLKRKDKPHAYIGNMRARDTYTVWLDEDEGDPS